MDKKRIMPLIGILLVIVLASSVFAEDVAYVYRRDFMIDDNVLNAFSDLGLSVELIDESSLPINWDDYKLIFVGDENYRNEDLIPIGDYPSVVANSYHGKEWGLVDDSIGQLGGTGPLYVRLFDDGIKQVYTQAAYGSSIAIPYNYLGDTPEHSNIASGLTPIAGTYQGNHYSLGAVVAYGDIGAQLWTRQLDAKLCFYGIMDKTSSFPISSNYWTQNARDLFEDCVYYVASECSEDSHCNVPVKKCVGTYCMCDSNSECVTEIKTDDGIVGATWPPGINEFFDSSNLPQINDLYANYYVGFPGSLEKRCIQIQEYASFIGIDAYIRFSSVSSNVSSGDNYEIWETWYNCNESISGG